MIKNCKATSQSRVKVILIKFLLVIILSPSGSAFAIWIFAPNVIPQATWYWNGGRPRAIFECRGEDHSSKAVILGNEVSFRTTSNENSEAACKNWINVSTDLLDNNKNLKDIEWLSENFWVKNGQGIYLEEYPIEFSQVKITGNDFAGWFRVNSEEYFSEGVFVSPLTLKPVKGKRSYGGGGSAFIHRGQHHGDKLLDIDFNSNSIEIDFYLSMNNTFNALRTTSPLKFDPKTGKFLGKVILQTVPLAKGAEGARIAEFAISGVVGGKGGRIVVAVLHDGSRFANDIVGLSKLNSNLLWGFTHFIAVGK
jgi:hypothetical protein